MDVCFTTLLSIGDTQLTDFGAITPWHVDQSTIANLSSHFSVTRRPIEDDIDLIRPFSGQHGFDDRFGLQEIIAKKSCRRAFYFSCFDSDRFLLLLFPRAVALSIHQLFKVGNIDSEAALPRH